MSMASGSTIFPRCETRSAMPVLGNPLNRGRAVTLTLDQFRYGWANALSEALATVGQYEVERRPTNIR